MKKPKDRSAESWVLMSSDRGCCKRGKPAGERKQGAEEQEQEQEPVSARASAPELHKSQNCLIAGLFTKILP